ncbi:hypothetical protein ACHAXT_000924 [Thalassiosira profunda]
MPSSQPQKRPPPPPRTHLDNEDIRCVASPYSPSGISAPVASAEVKEVLLDRLRKEITSKMGGSVCRRRSSGGKPSGKKRRRGDGDASIDGEVGRKGDALSAMGGDDAAANRAGGSDAPMSTAESVVRSRFIVGINQCTRALEGACKRRAQQTAQGAESDASMPSLVLLARDVRPATIIAHISIYAHILGIPTLVLPGKASAELGAAAGIRSVAAAIFLSSPGEEGTPDDEQKEREWRDAHNEVNSFVKYAVSKIPREA